MHPGADPSQCEHVGPRVDANVVLFAQIVSISPSQMSYHQYLSAFARLSFTPASSRDCIDGWLQSDTLSSVPLRSDQISGLVVSREIICLDNYECAAPAVRKPWEMDRMEFR